MPIFSTAGVALGVVTGRRVGPANPTLGPAPMWACLDACAFNSPARRHAIAAAVAIAPFGPDLTSVNSYATVQNILMVCHQRSHVHSPCSCCCITHHGGTRRPCTALTCQPRMPWITTSVVLARQMETFMMSSGVSDAHFHSPRRIAHVMIQTRVCAHRQH
jgi:hypothetical protein